MLLISSDDGSLDTHKQEPLRTQGSQWTSGVCTYSHRDETATCRRI